LLFNFSELLCEDLSFALTGIDLFFEDLCALLEYLDLLGLFLVRDGVPLVVLYDALRADVQGAGLAPVFRLLVRVLQAVLLRWVR
jgi:hypothetical protein